MKHIHSFSIAFLSVFFFSALIVQPASAQAPLSQTGTYQLAQQTQNEDYLPPWQRGQGGAQADQPGAPQKISPPQNGGGGYDGAAQPAAPSQNDYNTRYDGTQYDGQTAATGGNRPPPRDYGDSNNYDNSPPVYEEDESYSSSEIVAAGHRFFGGVSKGLAKVVEYAFGRQGRPNGYILGEEAGGAFVAGLRYGEGTLHTKNAGTHRVYWQGPSLGYDFGAEGSKTMILVYNLRHVDQIYNRFAGVDGSAYFVGGVGITFQSYDDMVLAPIRSGVGLRLGANVGYLKYTRAPTWNPF